MDDTTQGAPAETPPAEGMRKLDDAVGGGEVPIGPLGGPTLKTREQMIAEQEAATEASTAEERKLIDAAKAKLAAETPPDGGPLS